MSRRWRTGVDAAAMDEPEDHMIVRCDVLRIRVPFWASDRTPLCEAVMGFCRFATQTTTSGVAVYHIPKNLEVELAGEKNPNWNVWDGEDKTWPWERVWAGESESAPKERLKVDRRQRAAQRITRSISR